MVQCAIDSVDNLEHIDCKLILLRHPYTDIDRWCDCKSYRMIQLHGIRTLQGKNHKTFTFKLLMSIFSTRNVLITIRQFSYHTAANEIDVKNHRQTESMKIQISFHYFYVSRFHIKSIWNEWGKSSLLTTTFVRSCRGCFLNETFTQTASTWAFYNVEKRL